MVSYIKDLDRDVLVYRHNGTPAHQSKSRLQKDMKSQLDEKYRENSGPSNLCEKQSLLYFNKVQKCDYEAAPDGYLDWDILNNLNT